MYYSTRCFETQRVLLIIPAYTVRVKDVFSNLAAALHHAVLFIEVIPFSFDLCPSLRTVAVLCNVILFRAERQPAGAHPSVLLCKVKCLALIFQPALLHLSGLQL